MLDLNLIIFSHLRECNWLRWRWCFLELVNKKSKQFWMKAFSFYFVFPFRQKRACKNVHSWLNGFEKKIVNNSGKSARVSTLNFRLFVEIVSCRKAKGPKKREPAATWATIRIHSQNKSSSLINFLFPWDAINLIQFQVFSACMQKPSGNSSNINANVPSHEKTIKMTTNAVFHGNLKLFWINGVTFVCFQWDHSNSKASLHLHPL